MGILNIFANLFGRSAEGSAPQTPEQRVEEQMAEMNKWLSKHKAILNEEPVEDKREDDDDRYTSPSYSYLPGNIWYKD